MNQLAVAPAAPLIRRRSSSPAPTDHVITAHLGLVKGIAVRLARRHRIDLCCMEIDDLVAIGSEALVEAAGRFDPTRATAFATFAYYRVQGAMLDALRANGCYRNRRSDDEGEPTEQILVVSLEAHESACLGVPDPQPLPDDAADASTINCHLRAAVGRLPVTERRLVEGYYFEDRSLDELGAELGRSRSWTCRLLQRAVRLLRIDLAPDAA